MSRSTIATRFRPTRTATGTGRFWSFTPLPAPQHRGRDLGVFNLTNTVPGMVMPGLTVMLVPQFGYDALFVLFAALSLASAGLAHAIAAAATAVCHPYRISASPSP